MTTLYPTQRPNLFEGWATWRTHTRAHTHTLLVKYKPHLSGLNEWLVAAYLSVCNNILKQEDSVI